MLWVLYKMMLKIKDLKTTFSSSSLVDDKNADASTLNSIVAFVFLFF